MRKPRLAATVATAVLGAVLSSCAGDEPAPAGDAAEPTPSTATTGTTATSEPAATLSAPPTESAASEEPSSSESPSATSSRAAAPRQPATMLLPADRMGRLNAEWTWAVGNDFDTEPARLTACHRVELAAIGAEKVAVREYTSELDAAVRAHHLVAVFPDEATARRTYAVLQSWRDGCRKRLEQSAQGPDGVRVTPAEPVSTRATTASSYVVIQPTATGSARIDNVATALQGTVVDLVVVKLEGSDFNYPRGRTPAAVAVRNATERSS